MGDTTGIGLAGLHNRMLIAMILSKAKQVNGRSGWSYQLASELNSVAIHLLRRIRSSDASLGVTAARLSALAVLVFGGPRSLTQLADAEQVAAPTMSRMVAALEAGGLVRREADPQDGRVVRLIATRAGKHLMERGRRLRISRLAAELKDLSVADQATLRRATRILRGLEPPS